ncbi:acyl-CoA dehydratase activase [Candidatus Bipolaricaulota bacterium]|nr:acyl-CoA dehydratase activase [Candidatus Bipolaricaulota bacterium]
MRLGIDIGSLTVKVVLLGDGEKVIAGRYVPSQGTPLRTAVAILEELSAEFKTEQIKSLGVSGSGGRFLGQLLSAPYVNELVAQTRAVALFHPQARTVIELGGQDSKLLVLEENNGQLVLADFALNTQCAAGTGSFLEQQAGRMSLTIEEFSEIAVRAEDTPYIAGRCSVFAKSDIIHLQQVGTPRAEIIGGLCMALARNFTSDVARGKPFNKPIIFQGGVSKNQGMIRAFEKVLKLEPGELIIPEHQVLMPAIGTALIAAERNNSPRKRDPIVWADLCARIQEAIDQADRERPGGYEPLVTLTSVGEGKLARAHNHGKTRAYLGIDVGSISTKAMIIDQDGSPLSKVYLRTQDDPLDATQRALAALKAEMNGGLDIRGVAVTGSGRELVGKYVGADLIKNEITTQARAAVATAPQVDTIFEIGGQDAKFIRLEDGIVVDFALNKACAAGTGSFLEEQAMRLGVSIEELVELALSAPQPVRLGERCTVFMESDLIHYQQRGAAKADLAAGLAYSIAINYLNRVVENRPLGKHILFQGGVAGNKAVVAAFEHLLGSSIIVPAHFEVTGAWGAALIAKEKTT